MTRVWTLKKQVMKNCQKNFHNSNVFHTNLFNSEHLLFENFIKTLILPHWFWIFKYRYYYYIMNENYNITKYINTSFSLLLNSHSLWLCIHKLCPTCIRTLSERNLYFWPSHVVKIGRWIDVVKIVRHFDCKKSKKRGCMHKLAGYRCCAFTRVFYLFCSQNGVPSYSHWSSVLVKTAQSIALSQGPYIPEVTWMQTWCKLNPQQLTRHGSLCSI